MAFKGVLSSWLTLAKNILFAALAESGHDDVENVAGDILGYFLGEVSGGGAFLEGYGAFIRLLGIVD